MTTQEFSNGFDVLYNNIMSNAAPGLDEYEKSIFLTKAQDEVLKNYFNPKSKGNLTQEGFDDNPKRQIDFSSLIKFTNISVGAAEDSVLMPDTDSAKTCTLPGDILFIINEQLTVDRRVGDTEIENLILQVVPLSYTEYTRLMSKPYKRPLKYQAWRIVNGDPSTSGVSVDIVAGPTDSLSNYLLRYVKRPNPIVVGYLDGATIEGKKDVCECELDPILHEEILQRAVELAKAAYVGDINSQVQMGQRSE